MKKFKWILFFSLVPGSLITSCSNDEIDGINYPEIEEDRIDLTDGLNVKIVDLTAENSIRIPLSTKRDVMIKVTDEKGEEAPFRFRIDTDADNLKALICDEIKSEMLTHAGSHLFNVHLEVKNSDLTKDLQIVIRNSEPASNKHYSQKYIGHAMNPSDGYQNVKDAVLDYSALQDIISFSEGEEAERIIKFETGGKRYDEIMQTLAAQTGITGDALFKGTFGATPFSHTSYQCDDVINYENYMGYKGITLAQVNIDKNELEITFENGNISKYLDVTVNDIFNNTNSEEYKKYSNDYEGIKALLDRVGAFVIANAGFGGTYQFKYSRKENTYYDHIGIDASTYLNRSVTNPGSIDSWFDDYSANIGSGDNKGYIDSKKYQASTYGEDYKGIDKSFSKISVSGVIPKKISHDALIDVDHNGVNIKDTLYNISNWEKNLREDPTSWTITNYRLLNKKNEFEGMELIPVYKFISESTRKEAVEKFFKDYLEESVKERETHHLVVADFYMEIYWNAPTLMDNQSHSYSPARYLPSVSPLTGDVLPRTVLVSNMNAPCRQNLALETNCDDFIVCKTDRYHYWYYVLGYDEDGEGFTDIRFSNKNLSGGWVRRGDHADNGTYGVFLDDNYVWIKTDAKAKYEDKVKGVALSKDKGNDEFYGDKILASSAPAEMDKTKPSDRSSFEATDFFKYWDTINAHPYDNTHFYEGGAVFYNRFKVVPNWDPTGIEETGLCWGENTLGVPNTKSPRNLAPYGE